MIGSYLMLAIAIAGELGLSRLMHVVESVEPDAELVEMRRLELSARDALTELFEDDSIAREASA
jgi:hypothetical protein